jgi:hypothetical protein
MKSTTTNTVQPFAKLTTITAAILFVMATSVSFARAQDTPSIDRDTPTPFTSNVVTGDGVDDKTEYFYSFNAGPGEVTITLDVKAEKDRAVSSVDIALFDAKSKKLMSTYANPDHGSSKRAVETVKVRGTQTLLLEVTVSTGVDNFKIKLDGAVKIDPAVGGSVAPADPTLTPSPSPSPGESQPAADSSTATPETVPADSPASAGSAAPDTASTPANAAAGSTNKAGKVNAKINSASSALSGIITAAGSSADSVKNLKKKKPQQ